MHSYASVCIHMHPLRVRRHLYAPACLHMPRYVSDMHQHGNIEHMFSPTKLTDQTISKTRQKLIAIRNATAVRS